MGKRGKPQDGNEETLPLKVKRGGGKHTAKLSEEERLRRDVDIIDYGWNNLPDNRR